MAGLVMEIPPEVLQALKLPEKRVHDELRKEFAVFLVKEGLLPRPQARQFAGMQRLEFEDLLAQRQVPWEGSPEDAIHDMEVANDILERRSQP